jgi:hypothetical protein
MPYADPANKIIADALAYQRRKANKKFAYKTREMLIMENLKLTAQLDDLNAKLLTATEGKRYIKPKSDIIDVEINPGNYTVCFE